LTGEFDDARSEEIRLKVLTRIGAVVFLLAAVALAAIDVVIVVDVATKAGNSIKPVGFGVEVLLVILFAWVGVTMWRRAGAQ
jgi:UPF0716 family protein affecting phage T7 exclusion